MQYVALLQSTMSWGTYHSPWEPNVAQREPKCCPAITIRSKPELEPKSEITPEQSYKLDLRSTSTSSPNHCYLLCLSPYISIVAQGRPLVNQNQSWNQNQDFLGQTLCPYLIIVTFCAFSSTSALLLKPYNLDMKRRKIFWWCKCLSMLGADKINRLSPPALQMHHHQVFIFFFNLLSVHQ